MKNNKMIILLAITLALSLIILTANLHSEDTKEYNYKPSHGYVPDESTAIRIAEAVWLPIYGKDIENTKPFKAKLQDGIWIVTGTLSEKMLGGVPEAEISKGTGEVLRVSHGQ